MGKLDAWLCNHSPTLPLHCLIIFLLPIFHCLWGCLLAKHTWRTYSSMIAWSSEKSHPMGGRRVTHDLAHQLYVRHINKIVSSKVNNQHMSPTMGFSSLPQHQQLLTTPCAYHIDQNIPQEVNSSALAAFQDHWYLLNNGSRSYDPQFQLSLAGTLQKDKKKPRNLVLFL